MYILVDSFEPGEVVRLLNEATAREDDALADLIRLAMYSGARRGELCNLRAEHVKDDSFKIVDAKSKAGVRTVPIHRELAQPIARLIERAEGGYLLPGGDKLGKQFTRLKTSLGFDDRHVFHSIRKTFITALERAGVPESTVQDIVGHERSTLTGNTYSGKSTPEMHVVALAKLVY